jgi:starch phosphorylase
MSISGLQGPAHNVDTTQIGVPVVTPRKERPGHKRSLTGQSHSLTSDHLLIEAGSYFPSKAGEESQEWPLGDESTWKEALKAQTVDPENAQEVANSIVRHTTTTLGRQAFNMDDVSDVLSSVQGLTNGEDRGIPSDCSFGSRSTH